MYSLQQNSPLPDDRVLAVLAEETGGVWFGTEAGLARIDGEVWQVYRAEDMGLVGDKVYVLAVDGEDGYGSEPMLELRFLMAQFGSR